MPEKDRKSLLLVRDKVQSSTFMLYRQHLTVYMSVLGWKAFAFGLRVWAFLKIVSEKN